MGFSWNVWPWPWASPVHMQQLRQRNYWEDNYRKVRRTLNAQEVFAASLYDENRALKEQVATLQNENLATAERSRRQEELLLGARTHASRQEKGYQQQVNRLYARMHTLQSGPACLTDESVRDQMGRLCFELDTWVKLNFRDTDDLEPIAESEELHSTSPQRCSWLQAYVLNFVQVLIFAPRRFGLNDDEPFGHCVAEIEDSVHHTNSQAAFHNWKLATGSAVAELTKEQQDGTLAYIIQHIETEFRPATPQRSNSRKQQLRTFLENCVVLKNTLARQPDNFTFFRSPAGAEFSAGAMTSFDGRERGTVKHSLWPALVKRDGATPYVIIHAELVWMAD